ncbi:MAG: biotin/lipoyl-binding protein, partial [Phenylobacterium sp.]|nr:biotin/lipoyl-binding protein [Phenylobacterium sp.]
MNPRQRLLAAGLLAGGAALAALVILTPRLGGPDTLTGYVEGEPLYLAAPVAGAVREMAVVRGQTVTAGQKLFVVDPSQVQAQADQATAEASAADAQAEDVRKGQRPIELAALDAVVVAAEARAREARTDLTRVRALAAQGWYAPARLDEAQATADAADAEVAQA